MTFYWARTILDFDNEREVPHLLIRADDPRGFNAESWTGEAWSAYPYLLDALSRGADNLIALTENDARKNFASAFERE